jgi:hypothetical protein
VGEASLRRAVREFVAHGAVENQSGSTHSGTLGLSSTGGSQRASQARRLTSRTLRVGRDRPLAKGVSDKEAPVFRGNLILDALTQRARQSLGQGGWPSGLVQMPRVWLRPLPPRKPR